MLESYLICFVWGKRQYMNMDMFILNSLYLYPKQWFKSFWKNEWNNEQSKHNMRFQILWSWGIKYQSKPNVCGKNMFLIHYWPF